MNEAGIFDAQALLLEDPTLLYTASRLVLEQRSNAAFAWQEAARTQSHAADIVYVSAARPSPSQRIRPPRPTLRPAIRTAHDLTPSQVKDLDPQFVLGVCLETGSAAAHSTILAESHRHSRGDRTRRHPRRGCRRDHRRPRWRDRSNLDFPRCRPDTIPGNSAANTGSPTAAPPQSGRHRPAATRDGRRIRVFANISSVAEAAEAVERGPRASVCCAPNFYSSIAPRPLAKEEQVEAYLRAIARSLDGRSLVIRTLDVGGDKNLPYVDIGEEANPFLGWRGIRVTLGRPDLFRTQLRAILRTAAEYPVSLLLPMVSSLEEVRATRAILRELDSPPNFPLGVMIEVPAAVAIAPELAREASFFSIGSNDLIQYLMAADRTNPRVAALADPLQPAVLRTIRLAVAAARAAGIDVTLCGELAADPRATALLIGLGLDEFSVSPPLIPELKRAIAGVTIPEAEAAARPLHSSSEPRT